MNRNRRIFEFAEDFLLPVALGLVIGLAVFLLDGVYGFLSSISSSIVGLSPSLRLLSALAALLGGYSVVSLLAKDKRCGCGPELHCPHRRLRYHKLLPHGRCILLQEPAFRQEQK